MVQDTPTADATMVSLQKEQLAAQVEQVRIQNTWSTWTSLATPLTVLIGVLTLIGGTWRYIIGQRVEHEKQRELENQRLVDKQSEREKQEEEQQRWLEDRKAEREKRDEEQQRWLEDRKTEREKQAEARFQKVVEGLGSDNEATQVGSAILLHTFLRKDEGNERFYTQAFDLTVAHLRLRHADPHVPEPLTPLSLALITAFKKSYPLAHDWLNQASQALDATRIQLDAAYLVKADLHKAWMPSAYLRLANLTEADLHEVNLIRASLRGADLIDTSLEGALLCGADLSYTNLSHANLIGADLSHANLCGATLSHANLSSANLSSANLNGAKLFYADLTRANLRMADLSEADLSEADLSEVNIWRTDLSGTVFCDADLHGTHLHRAKELQNANLKGVKGLTATQLKVYQARGAIIDDHLQFNPDQPSEVP
ncbi:hypothetical protein KSF_016040 [Reticulibacter mediterranei]|uniref:Pentapeptide repeat-containing protein n=2 Tax=Reticulibacter mediterranei TaxID=2778369 RepID=A0A8J3IC39_9CHLR|nr:hypothetical protein KSF_016040 [Reticulibacter mediterranei]